MSSMAETTGLVNDVEMKMKAITQDRYGPADVLRFDDVDVPPVGDDDVLVRVLAAGLDRGVPHMMTGEPYLIRVLGFGLSAPKQRVPGSDVAGRIEAVGGNVTQLAVGDEVYGSVRGAFAELAIGTEKNLAPKPAGLTFEQAAVIPASALTALQAVRDHGEVVAGQHVLVIGASGGVGAYAVQIAKGVGAEVTGVASTAKLDFVRSIGADHVVDHTVTDVTEGDVRYDVILDIAGNRPLRRLRRALTPSGTLVIIGGEEGGRWTGGVGRNGRAFVMSPFVKQHLRSFIARSNASDLRALSALIEDGALSPAIDRTYPLAEVPDAIRQLEAGQVRGKIAISVSS